MREVSFTQKEANALMQLLDIAVKSNGLQSAGDALQLAVKLQQAFQEKGGDEPVLPADDLPTPSGKEQTKKK